MIDLAREDFERLDREDPLAAHRSRFDLPDDRIYLDGNSLGPLPHGAAERAQEVIERQWGRGLIGSWNTHDWVNMPRRIGDRLAPLLGADKGEVLVCDSTSVNLFKLVGAGLRLNKGRRKMLSEKANFPTDLHILQGMQEFLGDAVDYVAVERDQLIDAIDNETALVVLTHVHYRSGAMWDLRQITERAQQSGALMVWDLSHSTGAMPLDLNAAGADMAVGCGYKYLNGGPGAPAYLFVARRHHRELRNPLSGWFGHEAPFDFEDEYRPANGVARMQCGTPGVVAGALLEMGIEVFEGVDLGQVRQKSMQLGELFIQLLQQKCPELELASPRDARHRGSHVSLSHPDGYAIMQALIGRGVIGDFRMPDVMRFGFAPLYTRFIDVYNAANVLQDVLKSRDWNQYEHQTRQSVT